MTNFIIRFFLLIAFSFQTIASEEVCPQIMKLKLENNQEVFFCSLDDLMVSKDCYEKKNSCPLVKDYQSNLPKINEAKPLRYAQTQNPGSKICQFLKWKVLMGHLRDGGQVCTCEHPSGAKVICSSLIP